jgi:hypothetical protein
MRSQPRIHLQGRRELYRPAACYNVSAEQKGLGGRKSYCSWCWGLSKGKSAIAIARTKNFVGQNFWARDVIDDGDEAEIGEFIQEQEKTYHRSCQSEIVRLKGNAEVVF